MIEPLPVASDETVQNTLDGSPPDHSVSSPAPVPRLLRLEQVTV